MSSLVALLFEGAVSLFYVCHDWSLFSKDFFVRLNTYILLSAFHLSILKSAGYESSYFFNKH